MTSALGKLFGWSPFRLLQQHMGQVATCIAKMSEALEAFERESWADVESLAEEISRLEHEADKIKDEIRRNLTRRLFLPIDRGRVLEILALQDSLADRAEDVAVLLTIKRLKILPDVADRFREFRDLNIKAVNLVAKIINQLDELLETGFGGATMPRRNSSTRLRSLSASSGPNSLAMRAQKSSMEDSPACIHSCSSCTRLRRSSGVASLASR